VAGRAVALLAAAAVAVVTGCSGEASNQALRERRTTTTPAEGSASPERSRPSAPASQQATDQPTDQPTEQPTDEPTDEPQTAPEPRRSFVTIPAIGLRDFPVVRYRGTSDDAAGTALQDAGE